MSDQLKTIQAYDCSPFKEAEAFHLIQDFLRTQTNNIFRLSGNYKPDDDSRLAEYDYTRNIWVAGRFVGEAVFPHNGEFYKLTIKPRFGETMLLRMLEEIFNVQLTESSSQSTKSQDWQHFIRKIIAFIWLQKLANANLHGVPKVSVKKEYKGNFIKGRLAIRKSVKSWHRSDELVSTYKSKQIDPLIGRLISTAYDTLKSEFHIGQLNVPDSANDAINEVRAAGITSGSFSQSDYNSIQYKDIYLSWKPVVELSWDIVNRKHTSLKQDRDKNGYGFFIDMAEVWEQYLRTLVTKNLQRHGWRQQSDGRLIAYKGYFWQRELIPDLIFQKGSQIVIWDAKYKRMLGRQADVDRGDFFQIHTYIQYHLNDRSVKAAGLLYPISNSPDFSKYQSPFLINEKGVRMSFVIDGVEMKEDDEAQSFKQAEADFIARIIQLIS